MKVENMVKLKEEFDYKSLCRRLETELDRMVSENERLVKIREDTEDECARQLDDARQDVYEAESKLAHVLEVCQVNLLPGICWLSIKSLRWVNRELSYGLVNFELALLS